MPMWGCGEIVPVVGKVITFWGSVTVHKAPVTAILLIRVACDAVVKSSGGVAAAPESSASAASTSPLVVSASIISREAAVAACKTSTTKMPAPSATTSAAARLRLFLMRRLYLTDERDEAVDVGVCGRCFGSVELFEGKKVIGRGKTYEEGRNEGFRLEKCAGGVA